MAESAQLVLASASPRRRELLASLGVHPIVRPAEIDETPGATEAPRDHVGRLAGEKARAAARPGELVLAADTIVVLDGEILGKPRDPADAERTLARLAGREHLVHTGVALLEVDAERSVAGIETTRVTLGPLTPDEVGWYVATGEPLDKAGSYAVQGTGALFVDAVDGNYSNVVGLPLPLVRRLFRELGHDLRSFIG